MTKSTKKSLGIVAAASLVLHLLVYLLFHLPTLVFYIESDFWYDAVYYVHELLGMLLTALLPAVCAAAALALYPEGGARRPLLVCCLLSLTKLIYLLPYGYNYAVIYNGYDSASAILIALGICAGYTLLGTGLSYLLYLLMIYVGRRTVARASYETLPEKYRSAPTEKMREDALKEARARFPESIGCGGMLDLSVPYTAAIFSACFLTFCIQLLGELVEIVIYLVEYAGSYRESEIYYIIATLMTLLVSLFVSHLTSRALGGMLSRTKDNSTLDKTVTQ